MLQGENVNFLVIFTAVDELVHLKTIGLKILSDVVQKVQLIMESSAPFPYAILDTGAE